MYLAQVIGTVVSTSKDPRLVGFKLLLTRRLTEEGLVTGTPEVCVDTVGAGSGETVIVTKGSSARFAADRREAPIDSTIVGIVDTVEIDGRWQHDLQRIDEAFAQHFMQRRATLPLCNGFCKQCFSRAGLSAHQQRLLQDQRTVDCSFQRRIREVRLGTRKFTARSRFDVGHHSSLKRRCHVLSIARCRRCCR